MPVLFYLVPVLWSVVLYVTWYKVYTHTSAVIHTCPDVHTYVLCDVVQDVHTFCDCQHILLHCACLGLPPSLYCRFEHPGTQVLRSFNGSIHKFASCEVRICNTVKPASDSYTYEPVIIDIYREVAAL